MGETSEEGANGNGNGNGGGNSNAEFLSEDHTVADSSVASASQFDDDFAGTLLLLYCTVLLLYCSIEYVVCQTLYIDYSNRRSRDYLETT